MTKEINVFVEDMDDLTKEQWDSCCNHPALVKAALMPDAHGGYDAPIGSVLGLKNWVVPSWVGYDIGCGVCAVKTDIKGDVLSKELLEDIHKKIHELVPCGFNTHNRTIYDFEVAEKTPAIQYAYDERKVDLQLGTLGGGNHFIELSTDEDNNVWIVIHSGSRGFGWKVAEYWMTKQKENFDKTGEIGFSSKSQEGKDYYEDMRECLRYALINRRLMMARVEIAITEVLYGKPVDIYRESDMINRNHNHLDKAHRLFIHRKGATHSEKGMLGVIPANMRDGAYIVKGLGNKDSLWSSSHGAGRKLSRNQARKQIRVKSFIKSMMNIVSDAGKNTVDEAPDAYKDINKIIENQVENKIFKVQHKLKTILNVKG